MFLYHVKNNNNYWCLGIMMYTKRTDGISLKTHGLFAGTFFIRNLIMLICPHSLYMKIYKHSFLIATCLIILQFFWRWRTIQWRKDTASVWPSFVPSILMSILFCRFSTFGEFLWTLSQFMEPFCILPQFVYCYRDKENHAKKW